MLISEAICSVELTLKILRYSLSLYNWDISELLCLCSYQQYGQLLRHSSLTTSQPFYTYGISSTRICLPNDDNDVRLCGGARGGYSSPRSESSLICIL
jgi:hypothetical protein